MTSCGNSSNTSSEDKKIKASKNTSLYKQDEFYISSIWPYEFAATSNEMRKKSIDLCKEAGVNLLEIPFDCNEEVLNHCDEIGINVIAGSKFYHGPAVGINPLWNETLVKNEIEAIKNHKSVIGYHIWDEIAPGKMEEAKRLYNLIAKYDLDRLPFSCLYPPGGDRGDWNNIINPEKSSYCKYVLDCLDTVNPAVLSFDEYPFYNAENLEFTDVDWFKSMGYYRKKAKEYHIPFWTYIRTIEGYDKDTLPLTKVQVKAQMHTALAYGAKCISYFTTVDYLYVRDTMEKKTTFEDGREITGKARMLGNFLFDKDNTAIYHTGLDKQKHYNKIFFLDDISKSGLIDEAPENLIISIFEDDDNQYMMIVNKNLKKEVNGDIILKSQKNISEFNVSTGKFSGSALIKAINYTIEAGGTALFAIE